MAGKAEMTDASFTLLFHQIIENPEFRIQIFVDVHLTDIMEQIEIKVFHAGFFKLLFKYLLHFRHVGNIIPGKLCG